MAVSEIVACTTTLRNLNLALYPDKLGVRNYDLELLSFEDSDHGAVFLGSLKHPFFGGHFAQILNLVAPHVSTSLYYSSGIISDLDLPDRAADLTEERNLKGEVELSRIEMLNKIHREDPTIGTIYSEFDREVRTDWLRALRKRCADRLFQAVENVRAVDSVELFPDIARKSAAETILLGWGFLSPDRHQALAQTLMDSLNKNERIEYALRWYSEKNRCIAVDLKNFKGHPNKGTFKNISISSVWNDAVSISYRPDEGISSSARVKVDPMHPANWEVEDYRIDADLLHDARYPLLAWSNTGERGFLSQQAVIETLHRHPKIGLRRFRQGDVYLGRVLAAYLSPQLLPDWKEKYEMGLKDSRRLQPMMGGQMPIWVSLPEHAQDLLADSNPLFPALEAVF